MSMLVSVIVVYTKKHFSKIYRHEVNSKQWPGLTQKFKAFPVQCIMDHDGVLV
jgi:hypothetical protein